MSALDRGRTAVDASSGKLASSQAENSALNASTSGEYVRRTLFAAYWFGRWAVQD